MKVSTYFEGLVWARHYVPTSSVSSLILDNFKKLKLVAILFFFNNIRFVCADFYFPSLLECASSLTDPYPVKLTLPLMMDQSVPTKTHTVDL